MKVITIQRHQQYENSNTTDVTKHDKPIELAEIVDYIAEHKYHFTETLMNHAISKMENVDGSSKRISKDDVENYINIHGYKHPVKSNIYDITYTANMAYADFYPSLLDTTDKCIEYALAVANDVDGYEGIEFCRYLADLMGKHVKIDKNNFI